MELTDFGPWIPGSKTNHTNSFFSPYLKEAYKFLEKVFDNLRTIHMRDELIKDVYFGAYQHIGFSFMEKIIDERIIPVNMGALHQMSLGLVPKNM